MFSKNIRIVYLYVVSFIALFMFVGGTISLVDNIANYYWGYSSNSIYQIRYAFTSIIVIVVSVILYVYHWNKIEKEREAK